MIIWSGWGILVFVIVIAVEIPMQWAVESLFGAKYYQTHGWPKLVAYGLAAVPIWFIGRRLNRERIEPGASEDWRGNPARYRRPSQHTLLFVPMEYWAFIYLGIGIYFVITMPGF